MVDGLEIGGDGREYDGEVYEVVDGLEIGEDGREYEDELYVGIEEYEREGDE